jgi:hypothetical protein
MSASRTNTQSQPAWRRFCLAAIGPIVGIVVGILLVRVGLREILVFRYFLDQEMQQAKLQGSERNRGLPITMEALEQRDPRLETEPAVRVVTLFGLTIATEYAGLDDRAFYPAAPWYHLPSSWRLRLQFVFGTLGGLLGWLVAQQRAIGELRRWLAA